MFTSRRSHLCLAVTCCLIVIGPQDVAAQTAAVLWSNAVNASVSGDALRKTSGCDGCDDGGATSQQELTAGDGYVEFSATHPFRLYTFLVGSTQLRRYDVLARQFEAAAAMDIGDCARPHVCPADAAYISQPHSSDDDRVHSATLQNTDWQRIGCVVYDSSTHAFRYFAPQAGRRLDECHVDKTGGWLVVIETSSDDWTRYNRIVDLASGVVTSVDVFNGALGHLDTGHRRAVGADTHNPMPNATILVDFPAAGTRPIGPVVHYNKRWDIVAANHVAYGNATDGTPGSQYACGSNASRVADMADEIICFPLDPSRNADGSLDVLVVGPVMTNLDAAGGQDRDGDDYEKLPKGNLDVTGRYFIWTTNMGGERLDAFLVKIPENRLIPAGSD